MSSVVKRAFIIKISTLFVYLDDYMQHPFVIFLNILPMGQNIVHSQVFTAVLNIQNARILFVRVITNH